MRKFNKIFCIGLHKTGTSSLQKALEILDYKIYLNYSTSLPMLINFDKTELINTLRKFDGVRDVPFCYFYKQLDELFPNSLFILTTRNADSWIRSVVNHFAPEGDIPYHRYFYGKGDINGNEELYINKYNKHNREIREYFKGRKDFIVLPLEVDNKFKRLTDFLQLPNMSMNYPVENRKL